ncbi:hypothetical protein [Halorarum salinum]|uniref:Uncharacterized protein n=1 Tax=Halorarum salinum TaxID=2743089 RepID=A0A7D5QAC7_9EURY|nr:hypothetical protein [Halobaculum salinum]QLG61658.1 hypothetical protein HUG12_07930 [Halobaculum salinum]
MAPFYELDCTDCSFRTAVAAEFAEVFAEVEAHQRDRRDDQCVHFVNVHRRG